MNIEDVGAGADYLYTEPGTTTPRRVLVTRTEGNVVVFVEYPVHRESTRKAAHVANFGFIPDDKQPKKKRGTKK